MVEFEPAADPTGKPPRVRAELRRGMIDW